MNERTIINLRWASLESFWDVWWIAKPITEALLLNSDCITAADLGSSLLPPPYGTLFAGAGAIDLLSVSTMPKNSSVRSRYDECPCLACIVCFLLPLPDLVSLGSQISTRKLWDWNTNPRSFADGETIFYGFKPKSEEKSETRRDSILISFLLPTRLCNNHIYSKKLNANFHYNEKG